MNTDEAKVCGCSSKHCSILEMKKNNFCGNCEGGHTNQALAVCFATITIVITCNFLVKSIIGVAGALLLYVWYGHLL